MKKIYSRAFIKQLKKHDIKFRRRIMDAISKIPQEGDIKKLKGLKLKNVFRLRVGKYRVIFIVKEDKIYVLDIDSRGDIYK